MGIQVFYARQVVLSRPADQHGVCQCQFYAAFAVESDQPRDWNSYERIGGEISPREVTDSAVRSHQRQTGALPPEVYTHQHNFNKEDLMAGLAN